MQNVQGLLWYVFSPDLQPVISFLPPPLACPPSLCCVCCLAFTHLSLRNFYSILKQFSHSVGLMIPSFPLRNYENLVNMLLDCVEQRNL